MSKETKPSDKKRVSGIQVMELVIHQIAIDAAVAFPDANDSYDPYALVNWAMLLELQIIEAVKRKPMCDEPKYRDMSPEDKAAKILELTRAKVDEVMKRRERQARAEMYLQLQPVGPPPLAPSEVEEKEKVDSDPPAASEPDS